MRGFWAGEQGGVTKTKIRRKSSTKASIARALLQDKLNVIDNLHMIKVAFQHIIKCNGCCK